MTHLLEHNLFGMTKHLEIPVRSELARMHAILTNGTTEGDVMQLFEMVPPTSARAAIRLEAERMGHARFKYDTVWDEKHIIVRELAERRDNLQWGAAPQTALRTLYSPTRPLPSILRENARPDHAAQPQEVRSVVHHAEQRDLDPARRPTERYRETHRATPPARFLP